MIQLFRYQIGLNFQHQSQSAFQKARKKEMHLLCIKLSNTFLHVVGVTYQSQLIHLFISTKMHASL